MPQNKRLTGVTIGQILTQELFNEDNIVNCGPRDTSAGVPPNFYEQNFNKIDRGVDKHLKKNHNYVPHETYRPQVTIAFDFTDMFVAALQKETAQEYTVEARRLIDKSLLMERAREVLRFVKYYFEYSKTYKTYSSETKRKTNINIDTEDDANKFLNEVFNMFMTSINITRTRSDIGTATVTFRNVRNYVNGKSIGPLYNYAVGILRDLLVPMIPIKLWARGRFYNQWFFPIFDGYIVATTMKDTGGFAEIEIMCKDVLEIARFTTEMVNPALINMAEARKVQAINLQKMPFYGQDHMDMVRALFMGDDLEFDPTGEKAAFLNKVDSFGNYKDGFKFVKGIGFVPVDAAGSFIQRQHERLLTGRLFLNKKINLQKVKNDTLAAAKKNGITPTLNLDQLEEFDWYSNVDPSSVHQLDEKMEQGPIREEEFTLDRMIKEVSHSQTRRKLVTWGTRLTPYRVWSISSPDMFNADFASRFEILQEIAKNVYYDFYVDGNGTVHYHPFRFNNDFLFNDAIYIRPGENELYEHPTVWPGIYTIGPEESIGHNEIVNFEELVTFLKLRGTDPVSAVESDLGRIVGSALHKDYLERFGYRRSLQHNPMFNYNFSLDSSNNNLSEAGVTFMDVVAAALIIYYNGTLHTRNSTIIFRPELDIARPLFYTEDDMVFYIDSISHSITIGGDATTAITASFGRKIYDDPLDLQSFLQIQEGLWKYGEEVLDAEAFIQQLPITQWQNFLSEHQYQALEQTKAVGKIWPRERNLEYVEGSEEFVGPLNEWHDLDLDDPDTDFITGLNETVGEDWSGGSQRPRKGQIRKTARRTKRAKTFKGYK